MIGAAVPEVVFDHKRNPESGRALVSVVVSLYNYAEEIGACLESVRMQSHSRLELVIVDDASTDDSAGVSERWLRANADRFEHALLLRQPFNQGLSAARNRAFEAAAADYVFVLDADNTLYPPAIARLLEALQDSGGAAAYSQLVFFGEHSGLGVGDIWSADSFKPDNYIDAMALVTKAAWALVGGYSPMDYGWEDYDFWCKFVEAGLKGVFVPELLCRYRIHATSMRHTDTTEERARLVHQMMAAHPWLELLI